MTPGCSFCLSTLACCEMRLGCLDDAVGVSNYGEHHLDELLASASSTISPSINQVELSPFNQRRNLVAYCAERSIPLQAWGSLTAGQQLRPPKNAPWPPGYAKEKARTDDDGTSHNGLFEALNAIWNAPGRIILWSSIPCVGGCPFQKIN